MCPASRDPLFYHYDRRPRWRRFVARTLGWATISGGCIGLLVCLVYVVLNAWTGAMQNADDLDNWNPDWPASVRRSVNGYPDPGFDNLKALAPLPLKPGK